MGDDVVLKPAAPLPPLSLSPEETVLVSMEHDAVGALVAGLNVMLQDRLRGQRDQVQEALSAVQLATLNAFWAALPDANGFTRPGVRELYENTKRTVERKLRGEDA